VRARTPSWVVVAVVFAGVGCRPASVSEAEAKGDVGWLDSDGSADAVAALGRLADKDQRAEALLRARAKFDVNAFIAAWGAIHRNAAWGADLLRGGLQDPLRAEVAASAMQGKDPASAPFLSDVESAMVRLAASAKSNTLATVLAAAGAQAHDAIIRRLGDGTTRGAMCGGIANNVASPEARAALRDVPEKSRDNAACVGAVVTIAGTDDDTLRWLATKGEPGLIGAASREGAIACARVHSMWADALANRPASQYGALTVPLGAAVKRCPATMDGVLADALRAKPESQATVVGALDPFSGDDAQLAATCAALPVVLRGRASAIIRERASDALAHGCKGRP
jgi:hypothetical protein